MSLDEFWQYIVALQQSIEPPRVDFTRLPVSQGTLCASPTELMIVEGTLEPLPSCICPPPARLNDLLKVLQTRDDWFTFEEIVSALRVEEGVRLEHSTLSEMIRRLEKNGHVICCGQRARLST